MAEFDAFLVWVSPAPLGAGQWSARYDGREVRVVNSPAFATTMLDLRRSMELAHATLIPDRLVLDEIALLLGAHVPQRYCGAAQRAAPVRGGLQGWQRLRAEEMLRARLDGNITLGEMATACSLSVRHFARSFRRSFGTSAHQYLIRLRLERAKALLLTTTKSLAEVASSCGFCDQPAFTRAFSKAERVSPAAWRRIRR